MGVGERADVGGEVDSGEEEAEGFEGVACLEGEEGAA